MGVTYDYGSVVGESSDIGLGFLAALGGFMLIMVIIGLAISLLLVVSYWKIFKKCGKPGWYILIPILNTWTMLEICGIKGWWCLVPLANIIFLLISCFKLPEKLGKSSAFGLVLLLFPYIGFPILAFSKNRGNNNDAQTSYQQPQYEQPIQPQYEQPIQPAQPMQPIQPQYEQPTQSVQQPQSTGITTKVCTNCGNKIDASATTCFLCGHKF